MLVSNGHVLGKYLGFQKEGWPLSGAFTVPDTDTDTDTDKLTKNPIRICAGVCLVAVWTPSHNSIQHIFDRSVHRSQFLRQCEHTIKGAHYRPQSLRRLCFDRCLPVQWGGGLCPGGLCPRGLCPGGCLCPAGLCPGGPPVRIRAGSTHPTGMYSCLNENFTFQVPS